ncbi:MAG: hypothetical protein GC154_11390 [bacterium]|nr:hypothetical protein [bacterium]
MCDASTHQLLDRLSDSVSRLENAIERLDEGPSSPAAGDLEEPSREASYRRTLEEAAAALEKTKRSFRSKQLMELRQKIEEVLKQA